MLNKYKQLSSLERIRSPHLPGMCKLYYIAVENVSSDPSVFTATGTIATLPSMWTKLATAYVPRYSTDYKEELVTDAAGPYIEISISALLPFEGVDQQLLLNRLVQHRYIVLLVSPSGLIRYLGTKANPLSLSYSFSAGQPGADNPTAAQLHFSWRSPDAPLLLAAAIPAGVIA